MRCGLSPSDVRPCGCLCALVAAFPDAMCSVGCQCAFAPLGLSRCGFVPPSCALVAACAPFWLPVRSCGYLFTPLGLLVRPRGCLRALPLCALVAACAPSWLPVRPCGCLCAPLWLLVRPRGVLVIPCISEFVCCYPPHIRMCLYPLKTNFYPCLYPNILPLSPIYLVFSP